MDNFDLKKYLVENKVTRNSRMLTEQADREAKKPKHSRMMKEGVGGFYAPQYLVQKYGKEMAKKIEAEIYELDANSWDRFTAMQSAEEVHEYIEDIVDMLQEAKKPKHSRMMKEESGKPDKTSMRLFLDELGFNSADGLFRTAMNAGDVHELINMMADSAGGGQHPFDGTLTRGDFSQAGDAAGFSAEMIEDILDRDDVRTLERG